LATRTTSFREGRDCLGLFELLTLPFRIVGVLLGVAFGVVFSYVFLTVMHRSGELPPEPLGLAAIGVPESMFGLPIAYFGAVVLVGIFMLFANGGSGSSSGYDDGHAGGFGDGGDGGE
jgi:uncharacterized membrane protein YgcG